MLFNVFFLYNNFFAMFLCVRQDSVILPLAFSVAMDHLRMLLCKEIYTMTPHGFFPNKCRVYSKLSMVHDALLFYLYLPSVLCVLPSDPSRVFCGSYFVTRMKKVHGVCSASHHVYLQYIKTTNKTFWSLFTLFSARIVCLIKLFDSIFFIWFYYFSTSYLVYLFFFTIVFWRQWSSIWVLTLIICLIKPFETLFPPMKLSETHYLPYYTFWSLHFTTDTHYLLY